MLKSFSENGFVTETTQDNFMREMFILSPCEMMGRGDYDDNEDDELDDDWDDEDEEDWDDDDEEDDWDDEDWDEDDDDWDEDDDDWDEDDEDK